MCGVSLKQIVDELVSLSDENLARRVIKNNDDQWCLSELQDILAADVVEVVRCKDCAWYENGKEYVPYCGNPCSELQHPNDETFCSYGERREDDATD